MAGRGVHFALTPKDEARLLRARSSDEVLEIIQDIEERWDESWLVETDKAWDAIHRCLGDGSLGPGVTTLSRCILGGRQLYDGDDYVVSYIAADEVKALIAPLGAIDERWFGARYASLAATDYGGPHDEDDRAYTWDNFQEMRELFRKAAQAGRAVAFSVDQ
jgi:hypothetical protein